MFFRIQSVSVSIPFTVIIIRLQSEGTKCDDECRSQIPPEQYIVLRADAEVLSNDIHVIPDALTINPCIAVGDIQQTGQHGNGGGLARSVVP